MIIVSNHSLFFRKPRLSIHERDEMMFFRSTNEKKFLVLPSSVQEFERVEAVPGTKNLYNSTEDKIRQWTVQPG